MTLHTRFRITAPTDPETVFVFAQGLLGARGARTDRAKPGEIWNKPDQGFAAWLWVTFGLDGAELARDDDPEDDYIDPSPAGFVEVNFDTSYLWRDKHGGCSELHGRLIAQLGAWCNDRSLGWHWFNEFRGEWHERFDGLEQMLGDGAKAQEWATTTVLPAIAAHAAREAQEQRR